MIPDEYLQTFVIEGRKLLQEMEEALLIVEQASEDPEVINAIFRAAHTIKGSAGMFGIDHVVVFTHAAESVLDRVRSGDVSMSSALAALFIEAHDHLKVLIDHVAEGRHPPGEIDSDGKRLIEQLDEHLNDAAADQPENSGEMAESAVKLLDTMVPSIKNTSGLVQEIAAASEEQSAGVSQINTAMNQLNQITQQNASSSEQLAATSEQMSGQAAQLRELMAFFTVADSADGVFSVNNIKPFKSAVKKTAAAIQRLNEAELVGF